MKNLNTISYSILWLVAMLSLTIHLNATNYYCDPASGSMTNTGTSNSPWSTLEDVFDAGKTFNSGDVIYLRDGYHGSVSISGNTSSYVTIQAQEGHSPTVRNISFNNASYWILSGITISPEIVGEYPAYSSSSGIVKINSDCSYITIQNCLIYSAEEVAGWDVDTVLARLITGIYFNAPYCQAINNHITNTRFSIVTTHIATATIIRENLLENIAEDGVRCLGNYMLIENNLLRNWYGLNGAHDDGFQAWTGGYDSQHPVGSETLYGSIIRGNIVISSLPNNPFPLTYGVQGIGWFDGMFEDIVIENNLICTNMWHGITMYGATNCKIFNNTITNNPYDPKTLTPWIQITKHKVDGTIHSGELSTGNIIRNNITPTMSNDPNIGDVDHNIVTSNYAAHFVDYAGLDFHLKAISTAIDAGSSIDAPLTDLDQNNRSEPYDIGCYEFGYINNGDTEAPTVPTGLISTGVTMFSASLIWNASTDNVGVTDYRIYKNGTDPYTVQGTSATLNPLTPNTTFSFTVTALDAAGNESGQSTALIVTTDEFSNITSTSSWQTIPVSTQTGSFSASFDVVPNNNNMDGVVGILNGNAISYSSLACIVRFNSSGQIDAINGTSGYTSSQTINYSAGTNYHFRAEINVPSHTYTLFVTPEGQQETVMATNYAFRNEQSSVSSLNGFALTASSGSHTLSNISFVAGGTPPTNPTSVSVSPTTISLNEGEISSLTKTVLPLNATDQSVTWSSNNTVVATVDANGLVTAFGAGTATITVTTNVGGFTDNC